MMMMMRMMWNQMRVPTFPGMESGCWSNSCRCSAGKSSRTVWAESSWCVGRVQCVWAEDTVQPANRCPCCFSQGNVSGRAGLPRSVSPIRSSDAPDWQIIFSCRCSRGAIGEDRFTYANDMEMTQTRGHADRFHFSSWGAKSQPRASFGHSVGIFFLVISSSRMMGWWLWLVWHANKLSWPGQQFQDCDGSCESLLKDTSACVWARQSFPSKFRIDLPV